MNISEELLNHIGSKKIKCAMYRYINNRKDHSITFTLSVNYTDEQLKTYFERINLVGYPECDGRNKQVKHEVWLDNGDYLVKGTYFILGTQSHEPIPDCLIK